MYRLHIGYDARDLHVGTFADCLAAIPKHYPKLDRWARLSLQLVNDDLIDERFHGLTEDEMCDFADAVDAACGEKVT